MGPAVRSKGAVILMLGLWPLEGAAQPELVPSPASGLSPEQNEAGVFGRIDPTLVPPGVPAIVYIEHLPGEFPPSADPQVIEQRGRKFLPQVVPVLRGSRVVFPNRDVVRHNVFSASKGNVFNFGIYLPGDSREVVFEALGTVTLLCNIHEEMSAYALVLQNPFFKRVEADGTFLLDRVPKGESVVVLWARGAVRARKPTQITAGRVVVDFP
ncbi:MAG: hypothetical protein EXR76_19180 [Myxococcales bacterium]|nr:hypothetical protein [Myxococcales bacterium]